MSRRVILAAIGSVAAVGAAFVGLTLPAGAATTMPAPAASSSSPTPNPCDRAPWVSVVQGFPTGFGAQSPGGDYLWHDAKGFHLRVTHKGTAKVVYTGTITSPAVLHIEPVRLEKGDFVKLSADKKTITFKFNDYGFIDGVDFHTDCAAWLRVSNLKANDKALPTGRVFLGAHRKHPSKIPFVLHRNP
jgi:hypothetical protein